MIDFFVKKPATTIAFILCFIVLGFVSYFNLGIEENPRVDFPIITIRLVYPGATPIEIENQVIEKIEEQISEISDIKKVISKCYESFGFIMIEFNLGVNIDIKGIEVKDKVEAILNDLPDQIEKPIIQKYDPFARAVVNLVLKSQKHSPKQLYEFADKKLKNHFYNISGVSSVNVTGGEEREIKVQLDPMLMREYYISIEDVITDISKKNLNLPSGNIETTSQNINIRFLGEFQTLDDIRNTPITSKDNNSILLNKFATITDSHKEIQTISRFASENVVGLAVNKVTDANDIKVAEGIYKKLPELKNLLEDGMELIVAKDNTRNILTETKDTLNNIVIGILLTIIILYVFTGNFTITFIASIVIPTSIISSLFLVDFSNFTINSMTLLAIATSLGTLIANAIVIIENILSKIEKGKDRITASIDGTKEVLVAVIASSGTNLVVFTPIAFMGGIIGQFMKQFGLTVVYATIFSIIASFTLTPMLCGLLLKDNKHKKKNYVVDLVHKTTNFFIQEYKIIFNLIFKWHFLVVILCLAILVLSTKLTKYIGNEFIPNYDQNLITINLRVPQGSLITTTQEKIKKVENILKNYKEVKNYLSQIGGDEGVENAVISVNLIDKKIRQQSDLDLINIWIKDFSKITDAEIDLVRGEGIGGNQGDITIDVYGDDYSVLTKYVDEMMQKMKKSGYFRSVSSNYKEPKTELNFVPNQNELINYSLNNKNIASVIRNSIYGNDTNFFRENNEEYDIRVEISDEYKKSKQDLQKQNLFIIATKGLIPLTKLGEFVFEKAIPPIHRRDSQRIISIDGFLSRSSAGEVQKDLINNYFKDINFKSGYKYKFSGNSELQDESQKEILKAFVIATILTYILLVGIMNSFILPFVIATSIITSFAGVFLLLFFSNVSINIASMLAMIMLVGLVVNNAILVLEEVKLQQGKNKDLKDAIWLGFEHKFHAVLMTSIAIIAGAWPQMYSADLMKVSMSAVLIGGMLGSMFFTFILIPIIFWYSEMFKNLISKIKN